MSRYDDENYSPGDYESFVDQGDNVDLEETGNDTWYFNIGFALLNFFGFVLKNAQFMITKAHHFITAPFVTVMRENRSHQPRGRPRRSQNLQRPLHEDPLLQQQPRLREEQQPRLREEQQPRLREEQQPRLQRHPLESHHKKLNPTNQKRKQELKEYTNNHFSDKNPEYNQNYVHDKSERRDSFSAFNTEIPAQCKTDVRNGPVGEFQSSSNVMPTRTSSDSLNFRSSVSFNNEERNWSRKTYYAYIMKITFLETMEELWRKVGHMVTCIVVVSACIAIIGIIAMMICVMWTTTIYRAADTNFHVREGIRPKGYVATSWSTRALRRHYCMNECSNNPHCMAGTYLHNRTRDSNCNLYSYQNRDRLMTTTTIPDQKSIIFFKKSIFLMGEENPKDLLLYFTPSRPHLYTSVELVCDKRDRLYHPALSLPGTAVHSWVRTNIKKINSGNPITTSWVGVFYYVVRPLTHNNVYDDGHVSKIGSYANKTSVKAKLVYDDGRRVNFVNMNSKQRGFVLCQADPFVTKIDKFLLDSFHKA
ncbi:uncharacterized protein LOC108674926 isoform X2 [Hyalella azteca]|uniref:Uncharacterized protein LOC108674926 isoform X2 n=1 Tax=Hyalella azteca TaxID=294128 RepID=A0A979FT14_HYAAZ|nr:uncharacterized protein LOC108674926 isoform X2 [Hyalella azteca]